MPANRSVKRLPRAVREQQMLDAAVRVFSQRGYHDAAMDEIAALAGISKPMLYAYLGTKEQLFIACLHREGARLMEAVAAVADADVEPGRQVRRAMKAFFTFVATHRDGWSVLYRQARGQEPFAGVIAQIRGRWIDLLVGALSNATEPARSSDVIPAAYAVVGAVESLADWIVDHAEDEPEPTAERLTDLICRTLA